MSTNYFSLCETSFPASPLDPTGVPRPFGLWPPKKISGAVTEHILSSVWLCVIALCVSDSRHCRYRAYNLRCWGYMQRCWSHCRQLQSRCDVDSVHHEPAGCHHRTCHHRTVIVRFAYNTTVLYSRLHSIVDSPQKQRESLFATQ